MFSLLSHAILSSFTIAKTKQWCSVLRDETVTFNCFPFRVTLKGETIKSNLGNSQMPLFVSCNSFGLHAGGLRLQKAKFSSCLCAKFN